MTIPTGPGTGRYIIRAKADSKPIAEILAEILAAFGNDPAIKVVDTIGPAGRQHTVVAEMPHDTARSLEQRFHNANQLIIEPDRPLSLYE
jgi:hypothetical protein